MRVPSSRTRPHAAPDRERDRFRAARREHDLVGLGAERRRRPSRATRRASLRAARPGAWMQQRIAERVERRRRTPLAPRAAAGWPRRRRDRCPPSSSCHLGQRRDAQGVAGSLSFRNTLQYSTPAMMPPATGPTIQTYQFGPVARGERRAEPPSGVHGRARVRAERHDVERDHEADREPGGLRERPAIVDGGAEHGEDEEEGGHRLDQDALADRDAVAERRDAARRPRRTAPSGSRNFSRNAPATAPASSAPISTPARAVGELARHPQRDRPRPGSRARRRCARSPRP